MKTAIHFGAGNIGRGFIGMLLSQAGYKVIFADVQENVIKALQTHQSYIVEVVGENKQTLRIDNVDALNSNSPALIDAIAEADIITTAVGPTILKFIAPVIGKGIDKASAKGREEDLPIIACENAVRASSQLKVLVEENAQSPLPTFAHFVDAAVDRIVPPMEAGEDVLKVRVEEFHEWLVEKSAFAGNIPAIDGMTPVDNLEAGVERKLFTLNTGHAVCAWVGQYLGFNTIGEAIADARVKTFVRSVMQQSGQALIKKHGFDAEAHAAYIEKILKRFANPFIIDDVARVGRQPVRKLSKGERIASPMQTAIAYQLPTDKLLVGAVAAMLFKNDDDPQVEELQKMIVQKGVAQTFTDLSGVEVNHTLIENIYQDLSSFI